MKLKRIVLLCLFISPIFFTDRALGQGANFSYFVPNPFPSAPNTAAFAKFGSYPVNLYSGVPDISIPLYTIEAGGFKVPIILSYHASGIRIPDVASWVGLGWSVNCGGSITRKVYGTPDENGYLIETRRRSLNLQNENDVNYAHETVSDRQHDNMPDIYQYQIPGYSGKFFYDADSSFKIMMVPRSPLSVTGIHPLGSPTQHFSIADDHGNIYNLGANYQETTSLGYGAGLSAASAWMLENMISQNRRDTISFNYTHVTSSLLDGLTETITIEDNVPVGETYSVNSSPVKNAFSRAPNVVEQQLSTVYFKNGRIDFILSPTARPDLTGVHALDTIRVSKYNFGTRRYEVQKSIVFLKSHFGSGATGRLRLDGIQVLDASGAIKEQYNFTYNTAVNLPGYNSYARDYWGYYNGMDNSTDLIPQTSIQMIMNGGAPYNINIGNSAYPNCRDIDTVKMQANMLTSISYPTGGHTDFAYETNRYIDANHHLQFAGGLRIHSISSYDGSGASGPTVKTYQYDQAQPNFFYVPQINLNYGLFQSSLTYLNWITLTDPNNPIGAYQVIGHKRVRTFYAQPNEDLEVDGVPVGYTQVTEYTGTPGTNIGKSVYTFTWMSSNSLQLGDVGVPLFYDYSFMNGKMLSQKDYLHKADNSYQIVKSVTNTYGAWPGFKYDPVGLAIGQRFYNDGVLAGSAAYFGQETPNDSQGNYPFGGFSIQSGDMNLTSTTTNIYDTNDTTKFSTSAVTYNYDKLSHQQPTRVYHTDSKGNTIVTRTKYPADYAPGNAVIDTMVNRNMQAEVIERYDTLKNAATGINAIVSAQLNQFKYGLIPFSIVPSKISTLSVGQPLTNFVPSAVSSGNLTSDSRYVQMISFDQYDTQNNPTQYTPRNANPTSIIWNYQYENPVAQIKNATLSQFAYTSFEGDNRGNWSYSGTPVFNNTAPSGSMVYPLSSGDVTLNFSFDNSKTYVLSYWSNNGPATIYAGGYLTSNPLTSTNGWTYYESTVSAGTSTIDISGSTTIDELRLYPVGAQMTTYAYDPSGVRTISDTKGQNNYFEYDFAQRLKNSKDYLGNIIANYSYHTYDQTVANQLQTAILTRTNCPANTTPGHLTYTVPANKYYSSTLASANAEALYDVQVNGQAKANTVCGCPQIMVNVTLSNTSGYTAYQVTFAGLPPYNMPASGTTVIQVPQGSYSTVSISASSQVHTFAIGAYSPITGHSASVGPVSVSSGQNLTISIY